MRKTTRVCVGVFFYIMALAVVGAAPLLAQGVSVTSAVPNSTAQGTVNLNVTISGKGFKTGATAIWYVSGTTNPGGVTVNSVAFNSSSQLTANITVADTATIGNFDIVVQNANGRTGKGTGLFAVTVQGGNGNSTSCTTTNVTSVLYNADSNNAPFQILSDGGGDYTTISVRTGKHHQAKGVKSQITYNCFWTLDTTGSTSRGIELSLAYPYNGVSPSAPFSDTQKVQGRLVTHCSKNSSNNGINVGTMTYYGQTLTCPMNLGFYAPDGSWYNLAMNPNNWTYTTQAQITCTGASGGQCTQWTIKPNPATAVLNTQTNQSSAIGELVIPPGVGDAGGTPVGLYEVSFSFLIHL